MTIDNEIIKSSNACYWNFKTIYNKSRRLKRIAIQPHDIEFRIIENQFAH